MPPPPGYPPSPLQPPDGLDTSSVSDRGYLFVLGAIVAVVGVLICCVCVVTFTWGVCFTESFEATFQQGMNDYQYRTYLADKARAAGKERRPAGICCFYQNSWFRYAFWICVLGPTLLTACACIFIVAATSVSPTAVAAVLSLPSVTFIVCFVITAIIGYYDRDDGDVEMQDDAKQIDVSVTERLRDGTIRLISCAWLRSLGPTAAPLVRCQDLPAEAFLTAEQAVQAHERGLVYALSYAWMTAEHPDPDAHTLRRVISFLSSMWLSLNAAPAVGLFWEYVAGSNTAQSYPVLTLDVLSALRVSHNEPKEGRERPSSSPSSSRA